MLAKSGANIVRGGATGSGVSSGHNIGASAPFNKAVPNTSGDDGALSGATGNRPQMPRLESSNFFKMSGMPRFGK